MEIQDRETAFWSTVASEYIGFSKGNAVANWLNSILRFYGNPKQPYFGYVDNQATEILATNSVFTEASRSVDIRYRAILQDCAEGNCKVDGICTSKNSSGILPKPLYPHSHLCHARVLFPKDHPYYNEQYLTPQQLKVKIEKEEASAHKEERKQRTKQFMLEVKTGL